MTQHIQLDEKSDDILRVLMDPELPDAGLWSTSEFHNILEHQLETTLESEVERFSEITGQVREDILAVLTDVRAQTFRQLLFSKQPPGNAVILVKEYAKSASSANDDLPRDVTRVLYIAVLLKARKMGLKNLSSLDPSILERETRRCLTFGWLPDDIREFIATA
jgi:hypothetical protein